VATEAEDPLRAGNVAISRHFTSLLDRLGYRARLRVYASNQRYYTSIGRPEAGMDAGTFGWTADFPAASTFFEPLFTCRAARRSNPVITNPAGVCDPAIDARIYRAEQLQKTSLAAADSDWQAIDRAVTDRAVWVPLINPRGIDYVSERVGNYQRSPQLAVLLDRIWVR
jgi:peptide/nickel transport system substrate-binding protein